MEAKRLKLDENPDPEGCQHFVARKKRWCRMTVAKGSRHCGEHSVERQPGKEEAAIPRVPCPLDPKHTVFADRLNKHMKICNARETTRPDFIKKDVNSGSTEVHGDDLEDLKTKLSELDIEYLQELVTKITTFYDSIKPTFDPQEEVSYHEPLEEELSNPSYGPDTLKHLRQTSALIGSLTRLNLIHDNTCYIEFGAGKGQVSYHLAGCLKNSPNTSVLLIDRAAMRHKMDNKCENRSSVQRIRADIADLDLKALPQVQGGDGGKKKKIVGISKHLCGAATDLAIRCMAQARQESPSQAVVIAVCCHHRCTWRTFVGKGEFEKNNLSSRDFLFVIKMVSWAVCGAGMSRERRKLIEEQDGDVQSEKDTVKLPWTKEEQEEIGYRCKRIIDYSRLQYLKEQGYTTGTFYYIGKDVTLENLCIFAKSGPE